MNLDSRVYCDGVNLCLSLSSGKSMVEAMSLENLPDGGDKAPLLHQRPIKREKGGHNGLIKQRYLLYGSKLSKSIFMTQNAFSILSCCVEVVSLPRPAEAVGTILNPSTNLTQVMHRRFSKDGRKLNLGGRRKGSQLIEKCMKCRTINNWDQLTFLRGSNCTLSHQDPEIFNING